MNRLNWRMLMSNVFEQSEFSWQIMFKCQYADIMKYVIYLESISETISYFEAEETKFVEPKSEDLWMISAHFTKRPNLEEIQQIINNIAQRFEIAKPLVKLEQIEDIDWVSKVQENFKPFKIGGFTIYNDLHANNVNLKKHRKIKMNAGRAFGTGEHETTSGCIEAMEKLFKERKFNNIIDVGTGSGILAIAARKIWKKADIMATDIDGVSIETAIKNFEENEALNIQTIVARGLDHSKIADKAPFDLLIANILAIPLIEMAPAISENLASEGVAVLSGITDYQIDDLAQACEEQGLKLKETMIKQDWAVCVFEK